MAQFVHIYCDKMLICGEPEAATQHSKKNLKMIAGPEKIYGHC